MGRTGRVVGGCSMRGTHDHKESRFEVTDIGIGFPPTPLRASIQRGEIIQSPERARGRLLFQAQHYHAPTSGEGFCGRWKEEVNHRVRGDALRLVVARPG